MEIEPLITFESRSPIGLDDLCADAISRKSTAPPCSVNHGDDALTAQYRDDTESVLHVSTSQAGEATTIEAITRLERPIYSHLNSFAGFTITVGRKPAFLLACPTARVEVEPFDYPVGRPLRLAYVDGADVFHVVRAKTGEKGPFTESGAGVLPGDKALKLLSSTKTRRI